MIITRNINNPIITPKDIKPSFEGMKVIGAFNPGAIKYNNETLLLIRVAEKFFSNDKNRIGVPILDLKKKDIIIKYFDAFDSKIDYSDPRFIKTEDKLYLTSISHFRLAKSKDGINFNIDQNHFMTPTESYEEYGIEDPRIVKIEGMYYITYSAISRNGVVTALAKTNDFKKVEKLGIIFLPDNKDVVIFPEKINGSYYAINRPVSAYFQTPEMWISKSKDLLSYSNHQLLCSLRKDNFDSARIGASCIPFLTEEGWIEIYHGADKNNVYKVGVLLLDKDDPSKILYRSEEPLIEPEKDYEKVGFLPNVIFPCGLTQEEGVINLYYGNADENICLLTFNLKDLLKKIRNEE